MDQNSENENDLLAAIQEEVAAKDESIAPELIADPLQQEEISEILRDDDRSTEDFLRDELRSTESATDDPMQEPPTAAAGVEVPTVSLQVEMQKLEQRDHLHQLLQSWKIALDVSFPKTVIGRLQEAEALSILQTLLGAGFAARVSMQWPQQPAAFSEETEPNPIHLEGAPAVTLLDKADDVLLLTVEQLPQLSHIQSIAVVSAHKCLSRRFFKEEELQLELERELKRMQRSSLHLFAHSSFAKILRELCSELQRQALTLGANAVVGINLHCHQEEAHQDPSLDQMRLIAIGTASIVEK